MRRLRRCDGRGDSWRTGSRRRRERRDVAFNFEPGIVYTGTGFRGDSDDRPTIVIFYFTLALGLLSDPPPAIDTVYLLIRRSARSDSAYFLLAPDFVIYASVTRTRRVI